MVVGAVYLRLHLPGASSLKDKRRILRSVIERLKNRFNIAVAEVEDMDKWQVAGIGLTSVSNDSGHANEILSKAVDFVESGPWEAEVIDYELELMHVF